MQVLILFPLHQQHRVKNTLFELVLCMQNNTELEREKKLCLGEGDE